MRYRISVFSLAIVTAACSRDFVCSDEERSTLTVLVRDTNGAPLARGSSVAVRELIGTGLILRDSVTVPATGDTLVAYQAFEIKIAKGIYDVRVSHPGYTSWESRATVSGNECHSGFGPDVTVVLARAFGLDALRGSRR